MKGKEGKEFKIQCKDSEILTIEIEEILTKEKVFVLMEHADRILSLI